ncbi:chloroplast sensor kinase, chloroplastic isoform X2 [Aristolochia californica]
MDQLELRRVTFQPEANGSETEEIVILIVNFGIPTGLRSAEAALSKHQAQVIPESKAVVFPMVKHPFVVGFLVAELPTMKLETQAIVVEEGRKSVPVGPTVKESFNVPSNPERNMWKIQAFKEDFVKSYHNFTAEQESRAVKIALSLAMAYVMDQKALLLQQSSWQNNVRMGNLVEQIRGPLSNIRTLSKMLSTHLKRSEVSYDIIEDILIQGDHMRDSLEQLQEAVYLTKANIIHYNEEMLRKMRSSSSGHPGLSRTQIPDNLSRENRDSGTRREGSVLMQGSSGTKDLEMPMPPLALAALLQHDIRPCNVSEILTDLVTAAQPLVHKQKRSVQFMELSSKLVVAIEESDLRQALSNLIEGALLRTHVGGKVEVLATGAPAGGALIIIDDDGPDMHYMTQMHSLTPFGAELFTEGMLEDNMTWNFIAGLTIAREILESYGCVVRVISPRSTDAALGSSGTRVELWLPSADQPDPYPFPSEQGQQA